MNKFFKWPGILVGRYWPNAFVFALYISFFVFVWSLCIGYSPINVIDDWFSGMWGLHAFSMQMALILILGLVIAKSNSMNNLLNKAAGRIRSNTAAVFWVYSIASLTSFFNWGLGLVCGAIFSVAVAKKLEKVNFPLLLASAYAGFLVWHGGLSGSIPLKIASPNGGLDSIVKMPAIELSSTLGGSLNLSLLIGTYFSVLIFLLWMAKGGEKHSRKYRADFERHEYEVQNETFAQKLETSHWPFRILSFTGLIYVWNTFFIQHKAVDLNLVLSLLFLIAITLHKTIQRFLFYFTDSLKEASGILIQYPLYAGIMALMTKSGLAAILGHLFISVSTKKTFLFFTYLSSGLINIFVPSGGGQWVIQAPILIPAALQLGVPLADVSMAIAWGDAWTNMIQPFWALPLLSISGLNLSDIMGYCLGVLFVSGAVASLIFLSFSL